MVLPNWWIKRKKVSLTKSDFACVQNLVEMTLFETILTYIIIEGDTKFPLM